MISEIPVIPPLEKPPGRGMQYDHAERIHGSNNSKGKSTPRLDITQPLPSPPQRGSAQITFLTTLPPTNFSQNCTIFYLTELENGESILVCLFLSYRLMAQLD